MYRPEHSKDGLGILPLLLYGGAVAGGVAATMAAGAVKESWQDGWLRVLRQTYGGLSDPAMPPAPAPQFRPPAAPQTAAKLTSWTPDDLAEAGAQQRVQFSADSNYLREVMTEAAAGGANAGGSDGSLWLWLAAGAAALIFLRR